MTLSKLNIDAELTVANKYIYGPLGLVYSNLEQETESQDYGACRFDLNGIKVLFRVAKVTPTKTGQFVTIWKRIQKSPIMPFDASDPIDVVIISVNEGERRGHFIFPKNVLVEKKIFSRNNQDGKRAIRVYPPWDRADNRQAQSTQRWQTAYFFEFGPDIKLDVQKITRLLAS